MIDNIISGFGAALGLQNLIYCAIGVLIGLIIGILPGVGTITTLTVLLPFVYAMQDPLSGLIMMSGIYYGSQYGGSSSAILFRVPGEMSSVVIMKDGHDLARKGHAISALGVSSIGSFIGGTVATFLILFLSPTLINFAIAFGPKEYLALMILGSILCIAVVPQSKIKNTLIFLLGGMFSFTGVEVASGQIRYSFGFDFLSKGISFITVIAGVYVIAEVAYEYFNRSRAPIVGSFAIRIKLFSSKILQKIVNSLPSMCRGTIIGSLVGILPGAGALLSSSISYSIEKIIGKKDKKSIVSKINSVAGPESANNAGAQTSFIPMLSLGLPLTPVMVLLLGAMMVHGIRPGPDLFHKHSDIFYGLVASMWIGNLILLFLSLWIVKYTAKLMNVPIKYIFLFVLISCTYVVYIQDGNWYDLILLLFFSIFGYIFKKWSADMTPFIIGFVLVPKIEDYYRQSIQISKGNINLLIEGNITCFLYLICLMIMMIFILKKK